MNQQPIFLMGAHKSGTSLLRSLFDGHRQLFVIPMEAHFFQHLGYWIDYSLRRRLDSEPSAEDVRRNMIQWIERCNSVSDEQSDSDTTGLWDIKAFEHSLNIRSDRNHVDPKSMIESYIFSIYRSLYHEDLPDEKRIVEKSVEHAEFAIELKKMYPKAKFIHIIRNPYSNLVSIRKYRSRNGYPFLKKIVQGLYNSYYYLGKNMHVIGDDYHVIKYEDLVTEPERTVDEMARFTGIENEKPLFVPTSQGSLWKGNSTSNKKFHRVSADNLGKWKNEISPIEIYLVNRLFRGILRDWDYDDIGNRNALVPAKKEGFRTYLKNRLLLKYFI